MAEPRCWASRRSLILAGYIAWVWRTPRVIGRQNWQVQLPNGPLTLLQIVIGIVDLTCCAMAMYMLVPNEPHMQFIDIAVIFITATLLGFASHSPGGLGVFDAAMLIALWEFDAEELLAGLLIFRLLYYILPFTLALVVLGIREFRLHFFRAARCRRPMTAPDEGWIGRLSRLLGDARGRRRTPRSRRRAASDFARDPADVALLDAAVSGMPDPVVVLDQDGRVLAFNTEAIAIAPALRRGEPASIALRMPELVDAIRARHPHRQSAAHRVFVAAAFGALLRGVHFARCARRRRGPHAASWSSLFMTSRRSGGSRRCAPTSSPTSATSCARRLRR